SLVLDYTWDLPGSVASVLPWAAVVAALGSATVLALYRLPWAGFWGAWFFLILAPTSSVFPIADLAFEHRMYLPLAAGVVLLGLGGAGGGRSVLASASQVPGWLPAGLVIVAVVVLGVVTVRRNEVYRSEFAMW